MGNTCIPVADHVDIWQNQYNIVKLKNIKNIHKEKNLQVIQRKKNHIIYKRLKDFQFVAHYVWSLEIIIPVITIGEKLNKLKINNPEICQRTVAMW